MFTLRHQNYDKYVVNIPIILGETKEKVRRSILDLLKMMEEEHVDINFKDIKLKIEKMKRRRKNKKYL